jgi:CubicO group peptidase (beta-lactamase class C family)
VIDRKQALMKSVIVLILSITTAAAAVSGDDPVQRVNQLFATFDKPGSPGCSTGVIRNGSLVYKKSFGYASLELGVPLRPDSVFYMGSVSKQFTAASIVLAAEQGYLSLDDDVRKYLPELPDYGYRITLRQMLHQTSGFRDLFDLISLSGRNPAQIASATDILKLIARQKGLNNVPGAEWIYSNSNYFLLAEVVVLGRGDRGPFPHTYPSNQKLLAGTRKAQTLGTLADYLLRVIPTWMVFMRALFVEQRPQSLSIL